MDSEHFKTMAYNILDDKEYYEPHRTNVSTNKKTDMPFTEKG